MTEESETDISGPVNHLKKFRRWRLTGLGRDLSSGIRTVKETDTKIRVMNYNLLAPVYASQHQYLYTNTSHLAWPDRWSLIQREISHLQPDIITLQEVQFSHNLFITEITPGLEKAGYQGVAKCRTGDKEDGCAIFYKRQKFHLEFSESVEYNRGCDGILDKDNIAVIAGLRSPVSGRQIIVATTHLLFSPRRHEVRLAQTMLLLAEVERVRRRGRRGGEVPVIITGDFNTQQNTDTFRLLRHGQVEYQKHPGASSYLSPSVLVSDNCEFVDERMKTSPGPRTGYLSHRLGLRSVQQERGEVTTYHNVSLGWIMVDYIFYSTLPARQASHSSDGRREGKLKLVGRLSLPSAQQMELVGSLPNAFSPSDHLPLLADFLLVN